MRTSVKAAIAATLLAFCAIAPAAAQSVSEHVFGVMDRMRADIAWREASAPASEGNIYFNGTVSSLYDDEDRYDHVVSGWGDGIITIASFCSSNCSDIDLYVLDQNDNVIVSDTGSDTTPVVTFRPQESGDYRVRALMYACSGKCFYATAVYFRED